MEIRSRESFDEVAEIYDRARPGYPSELFDDLFSLVGLETGAEVLEIGPGTGQASVELARRGVRLTAIELGPRLAAVARRNMRPFPGCQVFTGSFEETKIEGSFDLVFAATAWHWLDPEIRYVKAARLLGPAGRLAIVTTDHVYPPGFDPLFLRIQAAYEKIGWGTETWPPPMPEVPADEEALVASGLFEGFHVRRYLWSQTYTAHQYVELLDTYSDHRGLDPERRDRLFRGIRSLIGDGVIRKHYLNVLQVAQRRREIG